MGSKKYKCKTCKDKGWLTLPASKDQSISYPPWFIKEDDPVDVWCSDCKGGLHAE